MNSRAERNVAADAVLNGLESFMMDRGTLKEYLPGQTVLAAGHNGDKVGLVVSGSAMVLCRDGVETEISVETLTKGDIYGEISFLTGSPTPENSRLVATEPCAAVEIAAHDFEDLLRENPTLAMALVKNLARKIMRLDRAVFKTKLRKRALQSLISRQEHIFPDYVIGDYVQRHLASRVEEFAASQGPVLLIGETGVGKEVLAHTIFRTSLHYKSVFLLLDLLRDRSNYAVGMKEKLPNEAEETEEQMKLFFGSEERTKDGPPTITPGYVELTEDGTLLVRGVDLLTFEMQRRLLASIRTGYFTRLNGIEPQALKIRFLATTDLDPSNITPDEQPLLQGLLERSLVIPPLRKRRREIPTLVDHYISMYGKELRKDMGELRQDTLNTLVNYSWPGNDVELSTTLKRAILVSEGGVLRPQDIYFDLKRVEGQGKFNLLRFKLVKSALLSPLFPAVFQSAVTPFFFILLALLFFGPSDPLKNPAALFAWAVGWPILTVGAFLWARFWCSLCPIGTLSRLAKRIIALEKPFPAFLKNHSDLIIATAVICIIWFETATDIRQSPLNVGLLLFTMLLSAVFVAVVFERQSWCRYVCGLGGMISVLSKASMVELRADRNVCMSQCTSNECYLGTEELEGCPFGIVAPKLHSNRFCKMCGACVKLCPHGAINLNVRLPGKEIWEMRHTNTGTALLIIGMIGGLITEMVTKTPAYKWFTHYIPAPHIVQFTVVFILVLLSANLMLALATAFSRRIFGDTFKDNYSRYGLALLPVALAGFMAFHIYYLINLGVHIPLLLSETFQFEIFRNMVINVPPHVTHAIQTMLMACGLMWSLFIIYRIGRASDDNFRIAMLGIAPHALTAIVSTYLLLNAIGHFFYST